MKAFDKINPLDQTAGAALLALTVIIGGVVSFLYWMGVNVSLRTANPISAISPYEPLTLTFSQAVRQNDVENQLQLQPATPGKLEWLDDHTAHFIPARAYPQKLTVHLVPGKLGANDEWLRRDISWHLTVREPLIVYLNNGQPKLELMTVPISGGTSKQLTSTGGRIFDFNTSTSGDLIVYSVINNQGGYDLWLINRDGQNPHKVLDCGAGRCSSPAFSPDGKLIGYNREAAGLTPGSPTGAPRPWVVDANSGDNRPVFADPQAIGYGISWSPDGNWLATYDGISTQIRVVNLKTSQQISLPSALGILGTWSPDSKSMVYPDMINGTDGKTRTFLFKADFISGEVGIFLGKASDPNDYSYRQPAWSPGGNQMVVSMRADPKKPESQLWLFSMDTFGGPVIASQPDTTYDFYEWDPEGSGIVLEQANLKTKFYPETAIWTPMQGLHVIAGNTLFPHWLP